jgi:hypothetical protein
VESTSRHRRTEGREADPRCGDPAIKMSSRRMTIGGLGALGFRMLRGTARAVMHGDRIPQGRNAVGIGPMGRLHHEAARRTHGMLMLGRLRGRGDRRTLRDRELQWIHLGTTNDATTSSRNASCRVAPTLLCVWSVAATSPARRGVTDRFAGGFEGLHANQTAASLSEVSRKSRLLPPSSGCWIHTSA